MSKTAVSKASMKNALIVCGIVAMFVVTLLPSNVDAGTNNITLASDTQTSDIMIGESVTATLTLSATSSSPSRTDIYMDYSWPSGESWTTKFTNANGYTLSGSSTEIVQGGSVTVKVTVTCKISDGCEVGDTNTISIFGLTDPQWVDGGTESGQSASGSGCQATFDGCSDTTPASASGNFTNSVSITFTARTGYSSSLACDAESNTGDNQMYQGKSYLWDYELTNSGWNDDTYTFVSGITSPDGHDVSTWTVDSGLTPTKLTGQSDSSTTAAHSTDGSISITPSNTARPGVYTIDLTVSSVEGADDSMCSFNVIVPKPDLEIKDTDISFSHTGAWINTRGDSQKVTIYVKVRNNGGSIDQAGVATKDIVVTFYVDGSQLGSTQTVSSLAYGEEQSLEVNWNPARNHEEDEVGIPIKVTIDAPDNIQESDSDNNEGNAFFKVVKTKSSSPSFYMSFIALIGAVGTAVLLSTYYRNKDLDD